MAKYSTEFKMKVVKAYLNNEGGYVSLAKKYQISNKSIVKSWVDNFKLKGYEGLKSSRKNKCYSFKFKQNIVKLYLTGEMSYRDLANQFKISNHSMIVSWVNDFRNQGLDGLKPKKRGRPSNMTKGKGIPKKQCKKEYSGEEIDEIKRLKDENYWLQMEIDFLKKKMELEDEEDQRMRQWLE